MMVNAIGANSTHIGNSDSPALGSEAAMAAPEFARTLAHEIMEEGRCRRTDAPTDSTSQTAPGWIHGDSRTSDNFTLA